MRRSNSRNFFQLRLNRLPAIDVRVIPTFGEQGLVRSALDDAAVVEHDDVIGVFHGRHAMRDDQRGASLTNRAQCVEDSLFRVRVDGDLDPATPVEDVRFLNREVNELLADLDS